MYKVVIQVDPLAPEGTGSNSANVRHDILFWSAMLLIVVFAGSVVLMLVRRYLKNAQTAGQLDTGFSLSDLRSMRDRGMLTPEEYELARSKLIAKVRNSADEQRPAPSDDP